MTVAKSAVTELLAEYGKDIVGHTNATPTSTTDRRSQSRSQLALSMVLTQVIIEIIVTVELHTS